MTRPTESKEQWCGCPINSHTDDCIDRKGMYDWCFSCDYLEVIVTTHTDDGSGPHPLCESCAKEIGALA